MGLVALSSLKQVVWSSIHSWWFCPAFSSKMAALVAISLLVACSCSALHAQVDQAMLADIINNMADYPQYNAMDNMDMYDDQPIDINDMPIVNKIAPDPPKVPAKNSMLPAYCDPPNPCPHGYTSKDGRLEVFENTAEFSRQHQAGQECMCDTEHMFNCPDNTVNNMFKKQEEADP